MNDIEQQLLASPEFERLLALGSGPVVQQRSERTLTQQFEQQVERAPDAIAVVLADQQINYGMLNARANQVAHYLRRQGIVLETPVAVCMERSVDVVIALLGILKAGGVYVPLDPEAPVERLGWIISDVKPAVLLTSVSLAARFSSEVQVPLFAGWLEALADEPVQPPDTTISVENLAYILYTSGSTGRPKGVMMSHRGISNTLNWLQDEYQLQPHERVMQKMSLTFDPSLKEIFWPLLQGARLIIAPPQAHKDSAAILALTAREAVSVQVFVPSLLQIALDEPGWDACGDLRLVTCGGEALHPDLVARFFAHQTALLSNNYGPTEAAMQCSYWNCVRAVSEERIPIGRPLNNVQLLLLDAEGALVPPGVPGELYIGGVNLARGYLGQAALTAERFVPHPWSQEAGARLYRTGDRVCAREDGGLEFLGRLDEQVKIRGIRVEPGEVEAMLRTHPQVQDVLVLLQKQGVSQHLIAYVISAVGEEVKLDDELRAYARERLPEALVPTFIQRLDAWPLTRHGKIDRSALPQPVPQRLSALGEGVPHTTEERALVSIWEQVLGKPGIGVHDNFFHLGGDSILSLQILSRSRQAGLQFTLKQLFDLPTISQIVTELHGAEVQNYERTDATSLQSSSTVPLTQLTQTELDRLAHGRDLVDIYPLAPTQQGMLFHSLYEPESGVYVEQMGGTYVDLDQPAFLRAWQHLVDLHPILRTSFEALHQEVPLQVVHAQVELPVVNLDWQRFSVEQQDAELATWLQEDRYRGLDLQQVPLFRFTLIQLTPQTTRVIWTFHHALLDGWSVSMLLQELRATYDAYVQGRLPSEEIRRPYRDYLAWLQKQDSEQVEAYWRGYLTDVTEPTSLRIDRRGGEQDERDYQQEECTIALQDNMRWQEMARQAQITLNTLIQGAWALVLARYSGQSDVLFGSVVAGRPPTLDGMERMLGLFINTVPTRVQFSDEFSVLDWLKQLQAQQVEQRTYEYTPLVQVQRWSDLSAGQSLFETLFVFENYPIEMALAEQESQLRIEDIQIHMQANYPLVLVVLPGESLQFHLRYDIHQYDTKVMKRLLQHLQHVLEQIVLEPQQRVRQVTLLRRAEREQLLTLGSGPVVQHQPSLTLTQQFERQVERAPDAIAAVFAEQQISYRLLNAQANQLAHYLLRQGVGLETAVGVCMERSLDVLVALLGILKAGGVYVPLDPEAPMERLDWIISDVKPVVLLTTVAVASRFPLGMSLPVLDRWREAMASERTLNLDCKITVENLAYVIYTSGSTGRPKGVMMSHRGISNTLRWQQDAYQLQPQERVLQKMPLTFDPSLKEIFWPLLCGARLVITPPQAHKDSAAILALTAHEAVSAQIFVPSLLQVALEESGWDECRDLRLITCGGEALHAELVARFFARHPARVMNHYGPTEAAVQASFWHCGRETEDGMVPIGSPINHTQLLILDPSGELVPPGVAGELYIGGANLARGYLGQVALTAERFVPHPWSQEAGARLYRTGDRVCLREDGALEFLGRLDEQVKIRGIRIEPGEVEAVLRTHPLVQDALVLLQKQGVSQHLIAYVISSAGEAIEVEEDLRVYARERMPEALVPTFIQRLDAWPLTRHGKIDRSALPQPGPRQFSPAAGGEPHTEEERILVAIWGEVLGQPWIGVHENFFHLGGDSILSLQILARARQAGLHITLKQLFALPTIAQLAREARHGLWEQEQDQEQAGEVALTPIQRWFFDQHWAQPSYFNQAELLRVPREWRAERLEEVLQALQLRHAVLRYRYEQTPAGWRQSLPAREETVPMALEMIDLSFAGSQAEQQALLEQQALQVQASLDLQAGPLWRAIFFRLGAKQASRLLLVVHHLLIDSVSWRVLLEELQRGMRQREQGLPLTFPPGSSSFQRWSQSVATAASSVSSQERDYWIAAARQEVAAVPRDLVVDETRLTSTTRRHLDLALSAKETQQLLHEALVPYRSQVQDLLLTALLQTLSAWFGARQVRLDLEGHGREEVSAEPVDLSRTVGWFTSLYPVLFTLPDRQSDPRHWIQSIKEQLRAVPNRGIGYGLLRYLSEDLSVIEALQAVPAAQISLNYLGQFDQAFVSSEVEEQVLRRAPESSGAEHGPQNRPPHLVGINALVSGERLRVSWSYNTQLHHAETIEMLGASFLAHLRQLIAHCQTPEAGGYTPSDFPLARLTQAQLDRLVAEQRDLVDIYPLTPIQREMFFHARSHPDSRAHIEQMSVAYMKLDHAAFLRAWEHLVEQHPILRTSFVALDQAEALQVIHAQVQLSVVSLDWQHLSAEQQHTELHTWLQEDRRRGIDLQQAPLFRFTLIQLTPQTTRVIWTFHHVLLDGWSVSMLLRTLRTTYDAYVQGHHPAEEVRRPYRDYLAWLQEQDPAQVEAYWRGYLTDVTEPTTLGIGRQRLEQPEHDDYPQEERIIALERSTRWQEMARASQITLNTLIQGAWALVLARYSGQSDVLFGSVVSGRPPTLNGMEDMLGMFTNSVPTRIQVPDELTVLDWLKEVQTQQIEQRAYEYIPASQAQRWNDLPTGQPLFETLLHFKNHPELVLQEVGSQLQIEEVRVKEQAKYPLGLLVQPGENLRLLMKYDAHRFSAVAIKRFLHHFQQTLEQMVLAPQKRVDQVLLLPFEEDEHLLALSSGPVTPLQPPLTLAQQFEDQVERAPDAIAVVIAEQQMSYGALNSRANQLAHYLLRQKVDSETPVGVCMERSLDMLVALLGILKAGGIYVPLDPEVPVERLSWIINDVQPVVLLTSASLSARFMSKLAVPVLDRWRDALANEPAHNPGRAVSAEQLAYIIYTSGSTGRPKGVMMSHAGITNSLRWIQQEYSLISEDRVLQKAALTFDPSIEEIFWPLLNGAQLVLARPGEHRDSLAVLALTAREAVSVQIFIPSLLQVALEESGWEACRDLRLVLCGGEVLRPDLVERFFARHPARVTNLYGPTEAAVQCSFWNCSREIQEEAVPIGYPLNNTQLLVLDPRGEPVPQGIAGELYIGGTNLARGYLGQPALTAERFVPDPWSQEAGARLYRTGDRAFYREDGALEFLGRLDEQVKIRGIRIEPGEVASVLHTHPLVQDVLVLLQKQGVSQHLVAYVISTAGKEIKLEDALRAYVRERLPEALVPTFIQLLDAWPLTRHGKIDRQALPQPGPQQMSSSGTGTPSTDIERVLVDVWEQVLGQPGIGIHDNFFHLGGDSILSAQILARARQAGFQFTLKQLFDLPTIAQLAREAHHVELTQSPASYSLKTRDGRYTPSDFPLARLTQDHLEQLLAEQRDLVDVYPLTSAQQRMFLRSLAAPGSGIFVEQMSITYADLDQPTFLQAWRHLVAQHPILRTSFVALEHEESLQIVHEQVHVPVVSLDWQHLSTEQQRSELDAFLVADRQRGLDLQHAPLLRFTLMQLTSRLTCVVWTYHHLLLDGWSVSLLQQELRFTYDAYMQGRHPGEEVRRPYRDYLAWLQEQDLQKTEVYWRSYLADVTDPIQLGIDRRSGEQVKQIYQQAEHIIAPENNTRWQKMTRQAQITLNTLIQGAWALMLARYSDRHDIVFGSIVSGRPPTLSGMESMLGLFINTLPIRIQVSDELSVLDWLRQIQQQQIEQRAYEYASLMQVQGWSDVAEGEPLFETVLNFENYPEIVLQDAGSQLKIEDIQIKGQASYLLFLRIVPGESLHLHLRYNAQRISVEAAQRLLQHLQQTMEQMVQQPQQRVGQVMLLFPAEHELLLIAGRGPVVNYQPGLSLAQQFEQQVERTPDAIAVALTEQQISYGLLNTRANQLAHYLRRQGVGPETPVGVGLERSLDVLVACFGILKAGGVYVPLDPEAPAERLDWILADVKPVMLLTTTFLSERFPLKVPVLWLDRWSETVAGEAVEKLDNVVSVENLAYMIYTSGSTGRPKGVMMSHRGISNSLRWLQDAYHLQPQERLLQKTSLTFDPSLKEICWPLLNGARLVVAPPQAHKDSAAILALTAREAVSTQIFIPSLFQVALDESGWDECRDLRLVMCGGEALQSALLERFFTRHHAQVTNLYGPTEAAVQCSFWNYVSEAQEGNLPIGHPINNTQLLILDPRGELVPQGIAGELYIGGANLARGYLGQPALTAERFVPDPWSQEAGARLYRTGDRACLREDGVLEFLGRLDEQVKIRGVRIEPGEVASILRGHPLVQDVLVLLLKQDDTQHLVAYVVSAVGDDIKLEEDLRAYARERVPEVLVPTFIQSLDAWPLTRHGKLDRSALPLPSLQRKSLSDEEKPHTEVEQALMSIWSQVLGRSEISIYDNFFELGGYSLLAMQLMNQVEQQLEQSLTLADLIEAPTIEQMAQYLQNRLESQPQRLRSPIVPLNVGGTKQPFFCVHPVSGDLLSYLGLTKYLDQDQPVYGIQATRLDEDQQHVPSMSIEQMATMYVNALLEFQPTGPYALGGHSFGGLVAFEMAQQLQAQGREVNTLLLIDSHWGRKAHGDGYDRTDAQWIAGLATILASHQGKTAPFPATKVERLSPEAQLIALRDHLVASEIVPQEMKLAGLRELLQTIKANIRSQLTYQPKMYQGKVILIRCEQSEFDDLATKWTPFSAKPLETYVVPGDHFSMLTEPYVQSLASQMQLSLDRMSVQDKVL